jgi:hypothetical protein
MISVIEYIIENNPYVVGGVISPTRQQTQPKLNVKQNNLVPNQAVGGNSPSSGNTQDPSKMRAAGIAAGLSGATYVGYKTLGGLADRGSQPDVTPKVDPNPQKTENQTITPPVKDFEKDKSVSMIRPTGVEQGADQHAQGVIKGGTGLISDLGKAGQENPTAAAAVLGLGAGWLGNKLFRKSGQ